MSKTLFASILLSAAVAVGCGGSSNNNDTTPDPTGNWDVTLTFSTGADNTCQGLPDTFDINFDITDDGGGNFTITAETGLTGDTTSGQIICTHDTCELQFQDTGPATEGLQNVDTQTITATLDEDRTGAVTTNDGETNQIDFVLNDSTTCTAPFTGDGDIQ
jgi:hypothetical protein|nr:hypothetical protein [Kofleriaceae bacterium]